MQSLYSILKKYKQIILYLICGGVTTCINLGTYFISAHLLKIGVVNSVLIAKIITLICAYLGNRIFVFQSQYKTPQKLIREVCLFYGCRLITTCIDVGIMYVGVLLLGLQDMLVKVFTNVVIIILNFIFSKKIVFKE